MNTLLREAKSDVLLFLDDDVIPSSRLAEAHLRNYEDERVAGVAGRVEQPTGDLPPESVSEVGGFRPWSGRMIFRFNGLVRQNCVFAQGANMSFDRRRLLAIGGFDEGFIGNGYFFESDATLRLARAFPHGIVFDPDASLKHLAAPRGGARIADRSLHHAFFAHNAVRLYRRHTPAIVYPFHVLKLVILTLAKTAFRGSPPIAYQGLRAILNGVRQDSRPVASVLYDRSGE
jgi:GT2 family glycosyltransferase